MICEGCGPPCAIIWEEKILSLVSLYFGLAAELKFIFKVMVGSTQNNTWRGMFVHTCIYTSLSSLLHRATVILGLVGIC